MKKITSLFLAVMLALSAHSQSTQQRGEVQTSALSRSLLTNESAAQWAAIIILGTNFNFSNLGQLNGTNAWIGQNIFTNNGNVYVGDGTGVSNIQSTSIFNNNNLIPAGASYDNAATWGYPQYTVTVNPTNAYVVYAPGSGSGNDQGAIWGGSLQFSSTQSGTIFIPGTNHIQLRANNPNSTVLARLFPATNFYGGNFLGNFAGVFAGTHSGNGFALTNLNISNFVGVLPLAQIPTNALLYTNIGPNQTVFQTPSFKGGIASIGGDFPWVDTANLYPGGLNLNFDFGPTLSSVTTAFPNGSNNPVAQYYLEVNGFNPWMAGSGILIRSACTNSARGVLQGTNIDGTKIYMPNFGMALLMIGDAFPYTNNPLYHYAFQAPSMNIVGSDNDTPFVVSFNDQRSGDVLEGQVPLLILDPTFINSPANKLTCGFPYQVANFWDSRQVGFPWTLMADENSGNVYATNGTLATKAFISQSTNNGSFVTGGLGGPGTYGGAPNSINGSTAISFPNANAAFAVGYQGDNRIGIWSVFGQFTKMAHATGSPFIITRSSGSDLIATAGTASQTDEMTISATGNATFNFNVAVVSNLAAGSISVTNSSPAVIILGNGSGGTSGGFTNGYFFATNGFASTSTSANNTVAVGATGLTNTSPLTVIFNLTTAGSTLTNFDSAGVAWSTNTTLTNTQEWIVQPGGFIKASGGITCNGSHAL